MRYYLFLSIFMMLSFPEMHAQYGGPFSGDELSVLEEGKVVTREKTNPDWDWPESTHFAFVNLSPFESFAVFTDFDKQHTYIDALNSSVVSKTYSPTSFEVDWEAKAPWPVNKSIYTTRVTIEEPVGETYRIKWGHVVSDSWDDTHGFITFEPYEGKTLVTYTNWVDPSSFLASLFDGLYVRKTETSVDAIAKYLRSVTSLDPVCVRNRCTIAKEILSD